MTGERCISHAIDVYRHQVSTAIARAIFKVIHTAYPRLPNLEGGRNLVACGDGGERP